MPSMFHYSSVITCREPHLSGSKFDIKQKNFKFWCIKEWLLEATTHKNQPWHSLMQNQTKMQPCVHILQRYSKLNTVQHHRYIYTNTQFCVMYKFTWLNWLTPPDWDWLVLINIRVNHPSKCKRIFMAQFWKILEQNRVSLLSDI